MKFVGERMAMMGDQVVPLLDSVDETTHLRHRE